MYVSLLQTWRVGCLLTGVGGTCWVHPLEWGPPVAICDRIRFVCICMT